MLRFGFIDLCHVKPNDCGDYVVVSLVDGLGRPRESAVKLCHDTEGKPRLCWVFILTHDHIKQSTDIWNNKLCLCLSICDFCCEILNHFTQTKQSAKENWQHVQTVTPVTKTHK